MSIPGDASPLLLGGGAQQYKIERSLRFNSSDSAYLSRTPSVAGNRKTWTWAGWVKRSGLLASGDKTLFASSASLDANLLGIVFRNDQLLLADASLNRLLTSQVFRDTSSWCHIVVAVDTTAATADDRQKIYVNGVQVLSFATRNNFTQNTDTGFGSTTVHQIARSPYFAGNYFDGYLADIHFIDGQALDPTSFTEVSATTGRLEPKQYAGTFGTNGFWLPFSDTSSTTSGSNAGIGKDFSGNGNYWNSNNLSVTAGSGLDLLVDTPTSYGIDTGAGGEVRGNYCTLNPLDNALTLSNGNLDYTNAAQDNRTARATIAVSAGKWYWECTALTNASPTAGLGLGIQTSASARDSYIGQSANGFGYGNNGEKRTNNTTAAYGATWGVNDVIGVAFDADNGTLTFYKNGVSQGQAYSGLTSGPYSPAFGAYASSGIANFGQRPFAYPVSGFKALCDTNLPAPVVGKPNTVMDVKTYTGNGSTQTISGLGFSPDLVWIKQRDTVRDNQLQDTVRGVGKELQSNAANPEGSYGLISSFNSDGFTVFTDGTYLASNQSGGSYAAWCWDAGSSTTTNNSGSISSQVRANASAGFSIVTYASGAAGQKTVGHGLNIAPSLIITKSRTSASFNWAVYHASATDTTSKFLRFNATDAVLTFSTVWGAALPTSTVFGITSDAGVVANTDCIAYCFAPVASYSAFGSYTGNGSADGPFVFTGMRPRWIMLKRTDSTGNWTIIDTSREGYNVDNDPLYPNLSDAEGTADLADILSNGFKLRSTDASVNASAGTYVYACFAEAPFALARAR